MRKVIAIPTDLFLKLYDAALDSKEDAHRIAAWEARDQHRLVDIAKLPHLNLVAREWWHKGPGNNYQSVTIYADDVHIAKVGPTACHGQHYLKLALDWLLDNRPELVPGWTGKGAPTIYLREMQGDYSIYTVTRERDL